MDEGEGDAAEGDAAEGDDAPDAVDPGKRKAVRDSTVRNNPFERVVQPWEQVVEDMSATAEEFRGAGYDVVELHPGDVTPLASGTLDVLVPNNEYDDLRELVTDSLTEVEVYRAEQHGVVFALAVINDPDAAVAVCCPVYYDSASDADDEFATAVTDAGTVTLRIRALSEDPVEITCDEPALFLPDDA